jgi:hypothetical protein
MSLEARIEALTVAINANTAALQGDKQPAAQTAGTKQEVSKEKTVAAKPGSKGKVAPAAANATSFEQVTKAVLDLAAKDKNKAVTILQGFNVSKASELTEDQYAPVLAKLAGALGALNEVEKAGEEESLV